MNRIRAGKQYYALIQGEKRIVTVKGPSQKGPGFWLCEIAVLGNHLTMFSVVDVATEELIIDEFPPELPNDC